MLHNFFIRGPPEAIEMDLSQEGPDQTFDSLHEINCKLFLRFATVVNPIKHLTLVKNNSRVVIQAIFY